MWMKVIPMIPPLNDHVVHIKHTRHIRHFVTCRNYVLIVVNILVRKRLESFSEDAHHVFQCHKLISYLI